MRLNRTADLIGFLLYGLVASNSYAHKWNVADGEWSVSSNWLEMTVPTAQDDADIYGGRKARIDGGTAAECQNLYVAGNGLSLLENGSLHVYGSESVDWTENTQLGGLHRVDGCVHVGHSGRIHQFVGNAQFLTVEAAGEDRGANASGLSSNFALGGLVIGSNTSANVRLDNAHANQAEGITEAIYVQQLRIEPGSVLDINGLNLYYLQAKIAPDSTVTLNGGQLLQIETSTWYVDDNAPNDPGPGNPTISDPNENGSMGHLFDSIQEAINTAFNYDTILVNPGMYRENIDLGTKELILSGTQPSDWGTTAATIVNGDSDGNASTKEGPTVTIAGGGIQFGWSPQAMAINNFILNNTARYSTGGGIDLYDNGDGPTIRNNTILANVAPTMTGAGICSELSRAMIINNIIALNQHGGISVVDTDLPQADYNDLWSNTGGNYQRNASAAAHDLSSDPIFADADGPDDNPATWEDNDYHLPGNSPCGNAGDPATSILPGELDIYAQFRVQGEDIDIGANELPGVIQNISTGIHYPTIQAAMDAAVAGNEVVLSQGRYTGVGNRDLDFKGKAITLRSANPTDPVTVERTVIDCQGSATKPHRGVLFRSGETSTSILSGLTITNGRAPDGVAGADGNPPTNGADGENGGAILCTGASPTIINCRFQDNSAGNGGHGGSYRDQIAGNGGTGGCGGAIWCSGGKLTLVNCGLTTNHAGNGGACGSTITTAYAGKGGNGGAIGISGTAAVILNTCWVSSNLAGSGASSFGMYMRAGGGGSGGGIWVGDGCTLSCTSTVIQSNAAGQSGNGPRTQPGGDGGALFADMNSQVSIVQSQIISNTAGSAGYSDDTASGQPGGSGGGLRRLGVLVITDSVLQNNVAGAGGRAIAGTGGAGGNGGGIHSDGNLSLNRCTISGNWAGNSEHRQGGDGGGVWCSGSLQADSCLVSDNHAGDAQQPGYYRGGNGGGVNTTGPAVLRNCTVVSNHAGTNTQSDEYAQGGGIFSSNAVTVYNCIVWSNTAPDSSQITGTASVTYSDIQGGWAGMANLDQDPLFRDPPGPDNDPATWQDNDYRLKPHSPCVNAGSTDAAVLATANTYRNTLDPRGAAIVDHTEGFAVGDLIEVVDPSYGLHQGLLRTITEVDLANLLIQFTPTTRYPGILSGMSLRNFGSGDLAGNPRVIGGKVDIGAYEIPLVRNATRYVEYLTVQTAIDAAQSGDQILIYPGVFYESLQSSGLDIQIRSLNPDAWENVSQTILNANPTGRCAMAFTGTETPAFLLHGLSFFGNHKISMWGGGGIWGNHTRATIEKCYIHHNSSSGPGSASLYQCDGLIRSCGIEANYGDECFGGLTECDGHVDRCWIQGNYGNVSCSGCSGAAFKSCAAAITNCLIRDNIADYGSALADCTGPISNCTIIDSDSYGTDIVKGVSGPISNCIIWGDSGHLHDCSVPTYSCIQNWAGGGVGNITSDPLLDVDGRLLAGSPCINSGDPDGDYAGHLDLDGNPRLQQCRVDIGAYESLYGGVNTPADLDGDCDVDGDDLIVFESCTTGPTIAYNPTGLPPGCTLVPIDGIISADVDRDGDVDQTDFGRFQRCLAGSGQLVDPHCSE